MRFCFEIQQSSKDEMTFNKLIQELSVVDIEKNKDFYINTLGFKLKYEWVEDKFIFVELDENQLMIGQVNNN